MKLRNIPFSPPDMSEKEAKMAAEAILSGWLTTGPKTKEFERKIAEYCHTQKAVCLNSATAAMEIALRLIGLSFLHTPIRLLPRLPNMSDVSL